MTRAEGFLGLSSRKSQTYMAGSDGHIGEEIQIRKDVSRDVWLSMSLIVLLKSGRSR